MNKYAFLHRSFLITGLLLSTTTFSIAQPRSQASSQASSQSSAPPAETASRDKPVYGITGKPASQTELLKEAWSEITSAVTESKGVDTRVQGVAALGLLGQFPQALQLLREAMQSPDLEVRIAAIQSAGETHNPNLTSDLRNLLDDKEPAVAFTSAITLWKMDDQSGEDILQAVVRGDRSANPGFLKGGIHNANRQLHSPASLAKIGAMQGAVILLPPVGIGMGAYQYLKGNAGESPRVLAVEQLAHSRSPAIKQDLLDATQDKDAGVRLAAAEALAHFRGDDVLKSLEPLFTDSKSAVRMIAYAAYIRVATGAPEKSLTRSQIPSKK